MKLTFFPTNFATPFLISRGKSSYFCDFWVHPRLLVLLSCWSTALSKSTSIKWSVATSLKSGMERRVFGNGDCMLKSNPNWESTQKSNKGIWSSAMFPLVMSWCSWSWVWGWISKSLSSKAWLMWAVRSSKFWTYDKTFDDGCKQDCNYILVRFRQTTVQTENIFQWNLPQWKALEFPAEKIFVHGGDTLEDEQHRLVQNTVQIEADDETNQIEAEFVVLIVASGEESGLDCESVDAPAPPELSSTDAAFAAGVGGVADVEQQEE